MTWQCQRRWGRVMSGRERLYLYWDPAIDGIFRRRLERALGGLKVDTADGDLTDPDPDNPGVVMALAGAAGEWALPARADIIVQAGPGTFPPSGSALRLEADDIDGGTARWARFIEKLRGKLGMASLALPDEDLAVRLDAETRRANEAEEALAAARLGEANAIRERDRLRADLVASRTEADGLKAENARLATLNDAGAFAIGQAPEAVRPVIATAREQAARAQLAAARASEAAALHPAGLAWANASYAGETRNGKPHGFGVMAFLKGRERVASYRGEFVDGRRAGLGIGASDDGLVWSGAWKDDEACGHGVLEAPDGRRFEGAVKPDANADGAPRPDLGWTWEARDTRRTRVHEAAPKPLPAPRALMD